MRNIKTLPFGLFGATAVIFVGIATSSAEAASTNVAAGGVTNGDSSSLVTVEAGSTSLCVRTPGGRWCSID